MQILSAQAADGVSPDYRHLGHREYGMLMLYVSGAFGGGTLTLEAKLPDGSGYAPLQTIPAAGLTAIEVGPAVLRLSLSGSTAPNLSAWVEVDDYGTRNSVRER